MKMGEYINITFQDVKDAGLYEQYLNEPLFTRIIMTLMQKPLSNNEFLILLSDLCIAVKNAEKKYNDIVMNGPPPRYIVATKECIEKLQKDIEDKEE